MAHTNVIVGDWPGTPPSSWGEAGVSPSRHNGGIPSYKPAPPESCECCIAPAAVSWLGINWCGYHASAYLEDTPAWQWLVIEKAQGVPYPAYGRGVG